MVVLPIEVRDPPMEWALVVVALATVEYPEIVLVLLLEELDYLFTVSLIGGIYLLDGVPVGRFDPARGIGHGDDPARDISDVQIELRGLEAPAFPAHQLPYIIH